MTEKYRKKSNKIFCSYSFASPYKNNHMVLFHRNIKLRCVMNIILIASKLKSNKIEQTFGNIQQNVELLLNDHSKCKNLDKMLHVKDSIQVHVLHGNFHFNYSLIRKSISNTHTHTHTHAHTHTHTASSPLVKLIIVLEKKEPFFCKNILAHNLHVKKKCGNDGRWWDVLKRLK